MLEGLIIGIGVGLGVCLVAALINLGLENDTRPDELLVTTVGMTIFVFVLALMSGYFVGLLLSHENATATWRQDAINRGVAEYFLNQDNEAEWRWTIPASPEVTR